MWFTTTYCIYWWQLNLQDEVQHAQQDLVQLPPPAQVPLPAPPAQVPNPVSPPAPPGHIPPCAPPAQVPNPVQPIQVQLQPGQPQLNWSYFKPEFSGKAEDVEAHLLRTNDWMETHNISEEQRHKSSVWLLPEKLDYGMSH